MNHPYRLYLKLVDCTTNEQNNALVVSHPGALTLKGQVDPIGGKKKKKCVLIKTLSSFLKYPGRKKSKRDREGDDEGEDITIDEDPQQGVGEILSNSE